MNYLYRHIRPDVNEVFYIGVGKQGTKRAWETRKRTDLWNFVVNKNNGIYKVDILFEDLTIEQADEKEIEFISLYGRRKDGGTLVNFQPGGKNHSGWIMPEDKKEKLRVRSTGNTYAKNHVWTNEERMRMSTQRKGKKNNLGKSWSKETKDRMSKSHLGNPSTKGKIWINNTIEKKMVLKDSVIPEGWERGRKF